MLGVDGAPIELSCGKEIEGRVAEEDEVLGLSSDEMDEGEPAGGDNERL